MQKAACVVWQWREANAGAEGGRGGNRGDEAREGQGQIQQAIRYQVRNGPASQAVGKLLGAGWADGHRQRMGAVTSLVET